MTASATPRRALAAAAAALVAGAAAPGVGQANTVQESVFQDDNHIVYGSPETVDRTLRTLRNIGVDRIRVSVYWRLIAPSPTSRVKPTFDATDPAAYPAIHWERYDRIVELARKYRLGVNFNITSPIPDWAAGEPPERADEIRDTYDPNPTEFAKFVEAVGRRYTGDYVPPAPSAAAPGDDQKERCTIFDPPCPRRPSEPAKAQQASAQEPIGRVSYWTIWNEPNQGGWLSPQWLRDPKRSGHWVDHSPRIYRNLVDAAWIGLSKSGHAGRDTILIGDIAPKGANDRGVTRPIKALRFVRSLYCVDTRLRPLEGDPAAARGCPTTPEGRAGFAAQHPALFQASGFAHHPYSLVTPPARQSAGEPDFATLADMPRLTRTLNTIHRSWGQPLPPGGIPIFFTEYGYQTNPPDPYSGYSLARQAEFLDQAEYMAYRNPTVQSSAQFLLHDDRPFDRFPQGSLQYWGSFQTGLIDLQGRPKPSFAAYRLPIWVRDRTKRRGRSFPLWGMLRMARNSTKQRAIIQYRPRGGKWRTIKVVKTSNPRGFFETRILVHRSGHVRIRYRKGSTNYHSRAVPLRVLR